MSKKMKLKTFRWKGVNTNGKKLTGEMRAINKRFVKAALSKNQIVVKRINQAFQLKILRPFKEKLSQKELTLLLRQMSTLFSSGIPLLQTINTLSTTTKKTVAKTLLNAIQKDIQDGHPFSTAIQKHPKVFDRLMHNFILVGEQSGTLDIMLERIATHREKNEKLRARIKKALLYPIVTVSFAIVITIVMLLFIVPQFESLFSSFGAVLPLPTRITIQISRGLSNHWYILLIAITLPPLLFSILKKRSAWFRQFLDKRILQIPCVGNILQKNLVARLCRTLSLSLASGIPLIDALDNIKIIIHNTLFYDAFMQTKKLTQQGEPLNVSLKSTKMFPNMMLQMVAIGEEAGKLSEMLNKAADYYEAEIDQLIDGLSQLIEPVMMMFLGLIIGGLIITMYLPIFKLGTVI